MNDVPTSEMDISDDFDFSLFESLICEDFYRNLAQIRVNLGFSRVEFAQKLGMPESDFAELENGSRYPSIRQMAKLGLVTGQTLFRMHADTRLSLLRDSSYQNSALDKLIYYLNHSNDIFFAAFISQINVIFGTDVHYSDFECELNEAIFSKAFEESDSELIDRLAIDQILKMYEQGIVSADKIAEILGLEYVPDPLDANSLNHIQDVAGLAGYRVLFKLKTNPYYFVEGSALYNVRNVYGIRIRLLDSLVNSIGLGVIPILERLFESQYELTCFAKKQKDFFFC